MTKIGALFAAGSGELETYIAIQAFNESSPNFQADSSLKVTNNQGV